MSGKIKITEAMMAAVQDFERDPRTEMIAMLLEAVDAARAEPDPARRAKALARAARTLMRLYPPEVLKGALKPARAQA